MSPSPNDPPAISSTHISTVSSVHHVVEPFLKWPGGKRWLANQVVSIIKPRLRGRYFEPFLGGGAVFFRLKPEHATISDKNPDLINVYRQVRDCPDDLLTRLQNIPVDETTYYRLRSEEPEDPIDQAVRFLYLNRTAFGGIYRLNQKGKLNVPYGGGDRTPEPLWRDGILKAASAVLPFAEFEVSDFEPVLNRAGDGDVVYCDPTYTVVHETNNFTRYNERNFSWADQERLVNSVKQACSRGALVLVSNACHAQILQLYTPIVPLRLQRTSRVSKKPSARRVVSEYLFIFDPNN